MAKAQRGTDIILGETGEIEKVSKVDTKGRTKTITPQQMFEEWSRFFHQKRFPPDYYRDKRLGYMDEYKGIILQQLSTDGLSAQAKEEAPRLFQELFDCPDFTSSYDAECRFFSGYSKAAESISPTLVAELRPFAEYHGLTDMPWGFGWLIRLVALRFAEPEPGAKSIDHREDPETDTYITWLYVTGELRNPERRKWLKEKLVNQGKLEQEEHRDEEIRAYELEVRFDKFIINTVRKTKRLLGHHREKGPPSVKPTYHPIDVLLRRPGAN